MLDVSSCFRHHELVTTTNLQRLGERITRRRVDLGYRDRVKFAQAIELSDRALADIEKGVRRASPSTYALIEQGLDWRPGTIRALIEGGDAPESADIGRPSLEAIPDEELLAEIRRRMKGATRAVEATQESSAPPQVDEVQEAGLDRSQVGDDILDRPLLPRGIVIPPKDKRRRRPK